MGNPKTTTAVVAVVASRSRFRVLGLGFRV